MKKLYILFTIIFISQISFAQPANDDCANADSITVSTTSINVPFDINTAVLNSETICSTTASFADVWYQFTMPFDGNVYVDGAIGWNNFALYDACGGIEIDCGNTSNLFTNLTSGNSYTLRVYRTSSTSSNTAYQDFDIKAFQDATNDDCVSAENITVSTSASTVNFEIGGASVINEVGCSGAALDYVDIWYDFTMPENGNVYLDGAIGWNNFSLYDSCGGTQIQCGSANQLFTGLTSGTNYKLRLFRTEADADNSYLSFTIKVFETAINDDCASSENITVTTTASTVNFNIGGAEINNEEGCTGTTTDYVDIWYDFTMPVNGNLYVDGAIGWNIFALYDTCSGTEIQCGSANQLFTSLTSGTIYKLRLFRTLANADNTYTSFTIKAFQEVTNDDCASAENITVTTDLSTINFDIGGASINNEVGCTGTTNDYADIWYDFTMPVNGNLYVDGAIGWNIFALYDTCSGTEIQCGTANQLFTGLTATTNYKLRVFRTLSNTNNNAYRSFTTQAFEIIDNDDCTTSETITLSPATPMTINFGIAGASINNEEGCSGTTAEDYADVWYDITMPQDGFLIIDGTISWNNFALYDNCAGTELGCFDTQGNIGGLTNGTTYKLRVFRTLANVDNTGYKSFSIESASTLSTTDLELDKTIKIYPNPVSDIMTISSINSIKKIQLFDFLGKKIFETDSQSKLDLSSFKSGMYLLKVKTDNGEITKKVIKN